MEIFPLHVKVTLIVEYDYDMDIKVQREEAKEEGIRLGKERGISLKSFKRRCKDNQTNSRLMMMFIVSRPFYSLISLFHSSFQQL